MRQHPGAMTDFEGVDVTNDTLAEAERWMPVPDYEDRYEVSTYGRVRSLRTGRLLAQRMDKDARARVNLARPGRPSTVSVHVLVLLAFVGPRPQGAHACHVDDDGANNALSNLYWGTPTQNAYDRVRNGKHPLAARQACSAGHAYTSENTRIDPAGARRCRACERDRESRRPHRIRPPRDARGSRVGAPLSGESA